MQRLSRPATLCVLMTTFVLGVLTYGLPEIYPFAAWSMFSRVPSQSRSFSIQVHRLGEQRFEPPRPLHDFPEFRPRLRAAVNVIVLNRLGHAVMGQGQTDAVERRQRMLEEALGLYDAEYEIVTSVYNPLERYRGAEPPVSVVGRFVSSEVAL